MSSTNLVLFGPHPFTLVWFRIEKTVKSSLGPDLWHTFGRGRCTGWETE